jgi:hypothetical protein
MSRIRWLCLLVFLLLASSPAWAQGVRRQPRKAPDLPKFNLSGTLDRFEAGRAVLTTEAGFTWILQPTRNVQVELTGKAVRPFLAPGHFIAFLAKLDTRRATGVEMVDRLTVFLPDKRRQPGIQPDLGFGDLEKETLKKRQANQTAAASGDAPSAGKYESPGKAVSAAAGKPQRGPARKPAGANVESFVIHGKIIAVEKGKYVVQIPNNPYVKPDLKIEVAEDAQIDVELSGLPALALVRPGDHVQARGDQVGEGLGYAQLFKFRSAQPLGAPPPRNKPPARNGSAQKKSPPAGKKTN